MSYLSEYLEDKDTARFLGITLKEYREDCEKIKFEVHEESSPYESKKYKKRILRKNPKIGDIWLVEFFRRELSETGIGKVVAKKRPFLIIDNKLGFVIDDSSDFHGFKITTKKEKNEDKNNRVEIKNWKELGLKEKSYVRIEMPIKIEKDQLIHKITSMNKEEVDMYIEELYKRLNKDTLRKYIKL